MRVLPGILLVLLTCCAFSPVCTSEFVQWDDYHTINDPRLPGDLGHFWTLQPGDEGHRFKAPMAIYIPATYTFWWALIPAAHLSVPDAHGSLLNSWIYHSANLLVHVLNVLLVWSILRQLLRGHRHAAWGAFLGALLFALHPIQTEAIAWASGSKDLLYSFFALLAIRLFIPFARQEPGKWIYYAIMLLAGVLAMLSKPTGVVTPLLLLAIAWLALGISLKRALLVLLPLFVAALPVMIIAKIVQPTAGQMGPVPMLARLPMAGDALAFYFYKIVWPVKLGLDYGWRPDWIVQASWFYWLWILPVALAILCAAQFRRRPWLALALLLFLIPLIPVLGLVPFEFQHFSTVADHYTYLAMFGVALALGWGISRIQRRNAMRAIAIVVGCLALAWGVKSFNQAQTWHDDTTLWTSTLATNPRSFTALLHLGNNQLNEMQFDPAEAFYRRSIAIYPQDVEAPLGMAIALGKQGNAAEEDRYGRIYDANLDLLPPVIRHAYWDNDQWLARDMSRAGRFDSALFYLQHLKQTIEVCQFADRAKRLSKVESDMLNVQMEAATRPGMR